MSKMIECSCPYCGKEIEVDVESKKAHKKVKSSEEGL